MNFKTTRLFAFFVLTPLCGAFAQQGDTAKIFNLNDVVVSATKTSRELIKTPVRITSIPIQSIRSNSILNADDILRGVSGMFVTRNFGIFDKHASVNGRGVGKEQARTLIMIDGVPINKTSTGSANFAMINTALIDRVEVVKGPNSNIYGGNAMGGTVNYITKEVNDGFRAFVQSDFGSFNTVGTRANVTLKKGKFYLGLNGFARKSDGYNSSNKPDSTTINLTLNEKSAGAVAGYRINENNTLKVDFNITDALRGKGERFYSPSGVIDGVNHYINSNYRLSYSGKEGSSSWNFTSFLSTEKYSEIKWKGSDIFDVDVNRSDYGAWLSYNYEGIKNNSIGAGIEFKGGKVEGRDIYRTSTDVVINKGNSNSVSLYLLDEINLLSDKLTIIPSLRGDFVWFNNGGFSIEGGTSITSYLNPYTGSLNNANWQALSPKLALRYGLGEKSRVYASASRGFRPGTLEDMTRTGAISGGVILANTALKPEHINTYEAGGDFTVARSLTISPSVYYSKGSDFHYAVNTGEKIKMGNKYRPLLSMQNIGKVEIYGGEIDVNYSPVKGLDIFANYSYTHSRIVDYKANPLFGDVDITGKYLTFTPKHMVNSGVTWRNGIVNITAVYSHLSSQYMDSQNSPDTDKYINNIPAYGIFNMKIWHTFNSMFTLNLGANNLFNKRYQDASSQYSIGRYIYTQLNISL